MESNINWDDVIKKEARGLGDEDLGEVQEVEPDFVITQKGTVHKHIYYLPRNLAVKFDGHTLWFKITKDEVEQYKRIHEGDIGENTTATNTDNYVGSSIDWNDVIKKEARGSDDDNFGEVHEVGLDFIVTQKGTVHKHKYYLPRNLAAKFDGHTLWFNITKDEVEQYKRIPEGDIGENTTATNTYNYVDSSIDWNDVIKKEARGSDDDNFGEVQAVEPDFIVTQKGTVNKHIYYLPRNLAAKFDGHILWFNITKDEVEQYKKD